METQRPAQGEPNVDVFLTLKWALSVIFKFSLSAQNPPCGGGRRSSVKCGVHIDEAT